MKKKPITRVEDLRAGTYIRAYTNSTGCTLIEIVTLFGRPFVFDHKRTLGKCWMMRTNAKGIAHEYGKHESVSFVSSLIGHKCSSLRLFPFNNKLLNYLNELKSNRIEFTAFLMNTVVTDDFVWKLTNDWEFAIWSDRQYDKMREEQYDKMWKEEMQALLLSNTQETHNRLYDSVLRQTRFSLGEQDDKRNNDRHCR